MHRPVERFAVRINNDDLIADEPEKYPMVLSRIVAALAFAMLGYASLRWLTGYQVAHDIASMPWIAQFNGAVDPLRVAEFLSIACFMAAAAFVLPPGPLKAFIAAPVAVLVFGALIWLQTPAAPSSNQPAYFATLEDTPGSIVEPTSIEPAAGPESTEAGDGLPSLVLQRDAQGILHSSGTLSGRNIPIGIEPDAPQSSIGRSMLTSLGHKTTPSITHLTVDRLTIGEIVLADARFEIVDQQPGLTIGQDLLARSAGLDQRIQSIEAIWQH